MLTGGRLVVGDTADLQPVVELELLLLDDLLSLRSTLLWLLLLSLAGIVRKVALLAQPCLTPVDWLAPIFSGLENTVATGLELLFCCRCLAPAGWFMRVVDWLLASERITQESGRVLFWCQCVGEFNNWSVRVLRTVK